MFSIPLPHDDLEAVLYGASESFETLRGARIFITGGTGFFGHWLLESLLHANRTRQLGVRATVLTRSVAGFRARSPWIAADASIDFLEGDVCTFQFPVEAYTHIVHAATDSGGQQRNLSEGELHRSIVQGTRRVLEFAKVSGVGRMLYVSSGAVYGHLTGQSPLQSTELSVPAGVREDLSLPSLPPTNYAAAKQVAEHMCESAEGNLETVIARCFAFVGPRLPLDQHFAIGNFIGAALAGDAIEIQGDGTPWRSWLYMSDLATWLWTLLTRGEGRRPYNVGSDVGYTIVDAAKLTAATLAPALQVKVLGETVRGVAPHVYLPCIDRARTELGLQVSVPLAEALRRTAAWHQR